MSVIYLKGSGKSAHSRQNPETEFKPSVRRPILRGHSAGQQCQKRRPRFLEASNPVECLVLSYGNGTPFVPEALVASHGRFTGWLAGDGGFRLGEEKSKNSSISAWAASRAVRLGRLKRFSTNLRTAV